MDLSNIDTLQLKAKIYTRKFRDGRKRIETRGFVRDPSTDLWRLTLTKRVKEATNHHSPLWKELPWIIRNALALMLNDLDPEVKMSLRYTEIYATVTIPKK